MEEYIISTVCTGIGSPEQACENIGIPHKIGFACEINKYARASYEAMFKAGFMVEDMTKEEWEGEEFYSDLFIGGIPCQSFSLAGLRKGELDPRGLLFYDYYRYVKKQKPKAFIIENVKGLLSDANGKTFQNWLYLLGQSVNGHHQMFNSPDSLPYNLHWTVLNTKDFDIPQNRERVFLVGIRDDLPNTFRFPKGEPLKLRLKDILELVVDEKYYLSDKALEYLTRDSTGKWSDRLSMLNYDTADTAGCITANHSKGVPYNMLQETNPVLISNSGTGRKLKIETNVPPLRSHEGCGHDNKIIVKEATKQGFAIANDGDSINITHPNSETRKGRVGKQIANCIDTGSNQVVVVNDNPTLVEHRGHIDKKSVYIENGIVPTLRAESHGHETKVVVNEPTILQTNMSGQTFENDYAGTLRQGASANYQLVKNQHRIRRLTPLECWRLQGFPDEQFYKAKHHAIVNSIVALSPFKDKEGFKKAVKGMSDSQLYKQAGNSMSEPVIRGVIKNILPCIINK